MTAGINNFSTPNPPSLKKEREDAKNKHQIEKTEQLRSERLNRINSGERPSAAKRQLFKDRQVAWGSGSCNPDSNPQDKRPPDGGSSSASYSLVDNS